MSGERSGREARKALVWVAGLLLVTAAVTGRSAGAPEALLRQLNDYPHAQQVDFVERDVIDHEFGLGMIKKVRGVWQFKESERLSGHLTRYTWQIIDGFTSREVMAELVELVQGLDGSQLLYDCEGRACGRAAEWANRVFGQRILYGREDLQRYQAFALHDGAHYRLAIYSAARTSDRQYLHVDLLRVKGDQGP